MSELETTPVAGCVSLAHEAGAQAWPAIALPVSTFDEYLRRLHELDEESEEFAEWLASRNEKDLWLACACYHQVPNALETFEREVLSGVEPAVRQLDNGQVLVSEVMQRLRTKLFLGTLSGPGDEATNPRILGYLGKSSLQRWVRAVATRLALDERRAQQQTRSVPLSGDVEEGMLSEDGPDAEHLRLLYGAELKRAVEEAVEGFSSKERLLLRYHYTDRLDGREIAAILRVHPSTITRRLVKARQEIAVAVRKTLRLRLGVNSPQLESILRILPSEIELSLDRILAPPEA